MRSQAHIRSYRFRVTPVCPPPLPQGAGTVTDYVQRKTHQCHMVIFLHPLCAMLLSSGAGKVCTGNLGIGQHLWGEVVCYPRRNAGLWSVSTRRDQHKAQKEMWLVSGLQDHRYLSVNKDAKMPVDVPLKKQSSVKTRRHVSNHRHAGFTGSISQPVTEFTYNQKRR